MKSRERLERRFGFLGCLMVLPFEPTVRDLLFALYPPGLPFTPPGLPCTYGGLYDGCFGYIMGFFE